MKKIAYLLVNFGGPRHRDEIEEFLIELLTDQEMIRTSFPPFLHRFFFTWVAKRRVKQVAPDYELIGGKSPIFEDTEAIAEEMKTLLGDEILTFHRYLPKTHPTFLEKMGYLKADEIRVLPLFPQFCYATTGSIALWLSTHLPQAVIDKLCWIKSYPHHPAYLDAFEQCIRDYLASQRIAEEECILIFSAHGLPQEFIDTGDPYEKETMLTFEGVKSRFPRAISRLSYQSQFGKGKWIQPQTHHLCTMIDTWAQGRKKVVIVPLSFTSDHIETLYEIEQLYLPLLQQKGIQAYRCPALNRRKDWVQALADLFLMNHGQANHLLIRRG